MPTFTTQTLTPLLSLPNISVLMIKIDVITDLDDAVISRVAAAWPNLKVFRIFEQTTDPIPRVTANSYLSLAAGCPRLEQLTLRFDASHIPKFAEIGDIVPARNLYRLNVCTSPFTSGSPEHLASFISLIFPSLSTLVHGWLGLSPEERQDVCCWEQVDTTLQPLLHFRACQRPSDDPRDYT
jgi:hypothetical protein